MAIFFDDGQSEIPDGVVGPVERVLVVGAGIAGLTVANALAHAAVECVVLEARSRIGGRLYTTDLAGSPVDLGGSWIHHPTGNPLMRFAQTAGIGSRSATPLPELTAFDCRTGLWLSHADVEASLTVELEGFAQALSGLRTRLGPDASAAEGIEAHLAATGLRGEPLRRARQGLRASVEADAAGAAEHQSLQWLWTQAEYGGDYFGVQPEGGYASVVDAMAGGLDVRQDWPVSRVEVADGAVSLTSASGATEVGSHVVVAVPLGALKNESPRFVPSLPTEQAEAVGRLGFGRYEKVALKFEEPFWQRAGWSHLVLFPREADEPASWVFDLHAFGADPILVCHTFHSATAHLKGTSPTAAARWLMGMLTAALGASCPEPVAVAVTDWGNDPYTRGAYTHVPPGSCDADVDLLATPVAGRLLFAGEHTQSARLGYADGAMTSGVREAKRLLGTPTVTLGRLTGAR
ncbi:flavin monoamine oxidase family protein [Nocardioides sp.]|uniref:flavin monoamine oxidase family protein n=1 Tax=Nocardioides sp. TaxID=35761 RepID=UPI003D11BE55